MLCQTTTLVYIIQFIDLVSYKKKVKECPSFDKDDMLVKYLKVV